MQSFMNFCVRACVCMPTYPRKCVGVRGRGRRICLMSVGGNLFSSKVASLDKAILSI